MAAKKNKSKKMPEFTMGIIYCAGLMRRYYDEQAAEFILKESGNSGITKQELLDGGVDQFDIDNLFPPNENLKVFKEIGT